MKCCFDGSVSLKTYIVIILTILLYCVFEIDIYQSMLGPLNELSGLDYMVNHRIGNFDSGEEIEDLVNNIIDSKKMKNIYIIDYSPRWSTMKFSFQYPNQIIVEYQLSRGEFDIIINSFEKMGFVCVNSATEKFGDFILFYFCKNKSLQYLVTYNPIDNRLLVTCFHYRLINSKSYANVLLSFSELYERLHQTPSLDYNLRVLEYSSNIFYSVKPAGLWKTQDPQS